jgi:pyruvate-formate lyase-activating enzyme
VAEVNQSWSDALATVRGQQAGYAMLSRGTGAAEGGPLPERFCSDLMERLHAGGLNATPEFWIWATENRAACQLVYVLAATAALKAADWNNAERLARIAVARDGRDLYAQRILLGVQARTPTLSTETDAWLKDRFCSRPFEAVETRVDGDVNTCCVAWMPAAIGNLHRNSSDQIWNSSAAKEIRRSVIDGDFKYCSRIYCPKITTRSLPRRSQVRSPEYKEIIRRRQTALDRGPRRVLLSHDRSCNLSCPSCRKTLIVAKKTEQDGLNLLADQVLLPMLRDARSVKITGSGDPFGSNHFRHLMKRLGKDTFPQLALEIQTNGQLLNKAAWTELRLEGRVDRILVSIDAARSSTYAIVRRGGTFRKLLRNLTFLRELRQQARVGLFQLDYVVQWLNYREIPEAVDLARRLHADRIYFQLLRNWGTYTVSEFELHNIANPGHPEYQDFLAVLRDPRLVGEDVDLGNMKPFVDEARQRFTRLQEQELHWAE